jgi:sigma-B regulation protein RsbU (phosphoserine phosphatase)
MATPIMIGDELIGILEIVNKRNGTFRESDVLIADLIARIIAIFIEKAELFSEQVGLVRMQKELEIARNLQTHMMPMLPMQIGPFHLNGQSLQVSGVGGDFWDVLHLNENEYLLVLGDVSGHGLSAALMMSAIRTASRVLASQVASPTDLLPPLNTLINTEFGSKNIFLTLILCHLKLDTREIHLARAGHEYPLIRDEYGLHQFKRQGGFPLGLLNRPYSVTWETIPLKPGHRLYLYTDGVLDGFPGEPEDLSIELADISDMDEHMETGDFFHVLRRRKNWESLDDATFLQLILQEV